MNRCKVHWIKNIADINIVLISSLIFILSIIAGCGSGETGGSTGGGKSVTLAWDPPTENADGSPLTDLAGYKIYYRPSTGSYSVLESIGKITTYTVSGLTAGTYYFAVTAYDIYGNESDYSVELSVNLK